LIILKKILFLARNTVTDAEALEHYKTSEISSSFFYSCKSTYILRSDFHRHYLHALLNSLNLVLATQNKKIQVCSTNLKVTILPKATGRVQNPGFS